MAYAIGVLVLVLGVLVSVGLHEVGHMVPAKRFGVRVSQYMVGFGPTLWSRTRGETEYGVKAIPLGGYVRLIGMYAPLSATGATPGRWGAQLAQAARDASNEEVRPGEESRAFYRLSVPKKVVVMLGGPVMNLLIAVVLLTVVLIGFGIPTATTTVESVSKCVVPASESTARECTGSDPVAPAAAAGILPGDRILSLNGVPATSWDALTEQIRKSGGVAVPIVLVRDGTQLSVTVTPLITERPVFDVRGNPVLDKTGTFVTEPAGFLGVGPSVARVRQPIGSVPSLTWQAVSGTAGIIVGLPARLVDVARAAFGNAPRDPNSVVGLVGVGRLAGEIAAAHGPGATLAARIAEMLALLASLNIALFVFNLVPLVPLDGGHVAGALWEGARRQVSKVRGRGRTGPADVARLMPLVYAVSAVLVVMGALLIYADVVNPVTLGG